MGGIVHLHSWDRKRKEKGVAESMGLCIKCLACPSYCKWHLLSNPDLVSTSAGERRIPEALQALLTWLPAKGCHEIGRNGTEYQTSMSNHSCTC